MATVTESGYIPEPKFERLLTAADLAVLPAELPSGPVLYELDNGRLIIMPPPGGEHGSTENKFSGYFFMHGEMRGLGKAVCGDVGLSCGVIPTALLGPMPFSLPVVPCRSAIPKKGTWRPFPI